VVIVVGFGLFCGSLTMFLYKNPIFIEGIGAFAGVIEV